MRDVRNPDGREVAGAVKDRQLLRVAPVCLDPLTGLAWDHGRCNNRAVVTEQRELAIDAISAAASLVAEVQGSVSRESLASFAISSGVLGIAPRNRTSPFLPSSAMLTAIVAL
jgi:hypothetical protein